MAIVRYTAEELDRMPRRTNLARAKAFTHEEVERMAFDDELEDEHGTGYDYAVNADGTLTHRRSGRTCTREALFAEVLAASLPVRDAAE